MRLPEQRPVEHVEQKVDRVVEQKQDLKHLQEGLEQQLLVEVLHARLAERVEHERVEVQVVEAPADEVGQVQQDEPFGHDQEHVGGLDRLLEVALEDELVGVYLGSALRWLFA